MASQDRVFLRCDACGNAIVTKRHEAIDPPGTRFVVTNECDVCNAADGGFGMEVYYDRTGNQLYPE